MVEDLPILLPDETSAKYRVRGISRAELAALSAPALADMVQKRLAALSLIQAKRMKEAAIAVAEQGMVGILHAASRDAPGAARIKKHAIAYADHPDLHSCAGGGSEVAPVTRS